MFHTLRFLAADISLCERIHTGEQLRRIDNLLAHARRQQRVLGKVGERDATVRHAWSVIKNGERYVEEFSADAAVAEKYVDVVKCPKNKVAIFVDSFVMTLASVHVKPVAGKVQCDQKHKVERVARIKVRQEH